MTDRELLEAAAKAAGIERGADRLDCGVSITLPNGRHYSLPRWNPLTDDGDALRLAVKLRIDVRLFAAQGTASRPHDKFAQAIVDRLGRCFNESSGADPYAATRRAIVRAAAEIGRA